MQECPFFSFALSLDMDLLRSDHYQTKTFVSSLNSRFCPVQSTWKGDTKTRGVCYRSKGRQWCPAVGPVGPSIMQIEDPSPNRYRTCEKLWVEKMLMRSQWTCNEFIRWFHRSRISNLWILVTKMNVVMYIVGCVKSAFKDPSFAQGSVIFAYLNCHLPE